MFAAMLTRLRALLQRRRVARELDAELGFHLEMEIQSNVERGMSPAEARSAALRDFGGIVQTKEAIRDVRTTTVESIWLDVRHAWRSWRARPGFGLIAAGMLGLGIGVTTAMFTLVDALILRPAPFHEPEQLASVYMGSDHGGRTTVAPAVLRAWRESPAFAGAESAQADTAILDVDGRAVTRGIAWVTPGLFDLLGNVTPLAGRLFDPFDGRAGSDDRVLLSEDVWRRLYNADQAIVGRRVSIDGERLTVVGILPADFRFPAWNTVIWRPISFDAPPPAQSGDRPAVYVRFSGNMPRTDALRLATDASRAADAENAGLRPWVRPVAGMVLDAYYQRAVPLLAGGAVLVFLVLCANVCSLLLARFTARRREFGMRAAIGASRGRLMRQAFIEGSLLGALGVIVGAGVGWALVSIARAFLPEVLLLRTLNPLNVDVRALGVTSASGLVATLAAGLLPAWIGARVNAGDSLRVIDRGGTETRGARAVTRGLLVVEMALGCTLLVGATLLVRSFIKLAGAERGLDTSGVITATMSLPSSAFPTPQARAAVARPLEEQVRQLPGVQRVAWSYGLPPGGGAFSVGDWTSDAPGAPVVNMVVERYNVGPEFFALYGIPLLRGRSFQPSDTREDVVVGERLALALWPNLDPLGRTFTFLHARFHVIGLAREIHHPSLDATLDRPEFYHRFAGVGSYAMLSIRCDRACPDPALVRQRLTATHPAVHVVEVRALDDAYFEQLARPRAAAALAFAFAAIAVLAAAGGLFSVLSYAVGRRRREFGIRSALGASPVQIRRVVLRDGLGVALIGATLGSFAALILARSLASLQYGVTVSDPLSWAVVVGVLALTTIAASWRPARQAMRLDPVLLLREE